MNEGSRIAAVLAASGVDKARRTALFQVARMLEISGDQVDEPELYHWLNRMQLQAEWTKARQYREPE